MPQEPTPPIKRNDKENLEGALEKASSGDRQDLMNFFIAFIDGPLFVPDRNQLHTPLNSAAYPNEFVRFLGIQDGERVIVPVFSRPELAEEWANHPITTNQYSGRKLAGLLPDQWWVCVNPGQEIEKDLSPWEIKKLIEGEQSIDEIIAEIIGDQAPSLLAIEAVRTLPELTALLRKEGPNFANISTIHLGRRQDLEALQTQDELILAIVLDKVVGDERLKIKTHFESITAPHLIGRGSLRVLVEEHNQSIAIGSLKHIDPIYNKNLAGTPSLHELIRRSYDTICKWLKKK